RGGSDHGRERASGDLTHLCFGIGARRRGRRAGRSVLHANRLLHGLLGRPEGVHCGRARRDRQSEGRHVGRTHARRDREPRRHLHQPRLPRRRRLHGFDPGAGVSTNGAAGGERPADPQSVTMPARSRPRTLLVSTLALIAIGAPLLAPNDYIIGTLARICLYATLALGLNIVVGFAGLLDIGYVAFFGIGSYIYALLCSPHFGLHLPFLLALPIVVIVTAMCGILIGAPTLRLRGDYLAI